LFGGPVAATCLLALNDSHLQQGSLVARTLVTGAILTGLYFAIAMALPEGFPDAALYVAYFVLAGQLAHVLHGEEIKRHLAAGGKRASNWKVAGISATTFLVTVGIVVGTSYPPLFASKGPFGGGNEVYYEDGATKEEARELGEILEELKFFRGDAPASVACSTRRKTLSCDSSYWNLISTTQTSRCSSGKLS
jgi:hypothetical protein